MKKQNFSRKDFLKSSFKTVLGIGAASTLLGKALAEECSLTPPQTEGPFYPIQDQKDKDSDLTFIQGRREKAKGQIIFVMGTVKDENCKPVDGVLVEIWQACESGRYNHAGDPNQAPLDPNFQYWGLSISDNQGRYQFKTIIPGNYPASPGWIRPSHIHFKVQKRAFHELTTQMYFEGNIYNAKDKILASLPPNERSKVIVKLEEPDPIDKFPINSKVCRFDLSIRAV